MTSFHPHYFAKISPDFLSFASFESASFLLLFKWASGYYLGDLLEEQGDEILG